MTGMGVACARKAPAMEKKPTGLITKRPDEATKMVVPPANSPVQGLPGKRLARKGKITRRREIQKLKEGWKYLRSQ